MVTLADGSIVKTTDTVCLSLGVQKANSALCLLDIVTRLLPSLTTNLILGMDFLHKYNPHIDWSQSTLLFAVDSCTVAVDASMVPGSICARILSASAWLCELCAEPELDCFLTVVHPCDGQKQGETAIDSYYAVVHDKCADMFEQPGLAPHRPLDYAIDFVDENVPPLHHKQYQFSANELDFVQKHVNEMLEKGWIRPSMLPYCAPILFV